VFNEILAIGLITLCLLAVGCTVAGPSDRRAETPLDVPFVVVLGIAQDGGVPQAGTKDHPGWTSPEFKRRAVALAIVDPLTAQRWLIDATPDFREQLHSLDELFPVDGRPGLDGIFLTHAHMGHYTGLMHLGLEVMGARKVPVFAMSRMKHYLETNGPWDQLVRYENILLSPLTHKEAVRLNDRISITPFLVPHRQEYSEVVGFVIEGPNRSVLFIPDIDKWEDWDAEGERIEEWIAAVDRAYLDGTFYDNGEIPGRDMSAFPHPFIAHSMDRFGTLPSAEKSKIRFIHLNHTNPALRADSAARRTIEERGFQVAEELELMSL